MILDIDDGRILEVFLRTDGSLCSVRVVREQRRHEGFEQLPSILGRIHVSFFVHGFEFGMESADHQVPETVGLNLRPVLDLIARNVLHIAGHVIAGIGIGSVGTDGSHQLVVFIRNEISGRFVGKAVDDMIDGLAFGLIGGLAVLFELGFNRIEKRLFRLVVHGSVLLGTLEHQMFQIVRKTGCFGRVVLASDTHGNVGLYTRSFLVDRHIDFQSVLQCVDLGVQRIIRNGGVLILASRTGCQCHATQYQQRQTQGFDFSLHCSVTLNMMK